MSALLIGIIATILIFGLGSAFLYSSSTGAVSLFRVGTAGTVGGILGSITMVFTNTWKMLTASLYGHLDFYGWILVGGIAICLIVWGWNAFQDAGKNKPINFVK